MLLWQSFNLAWARSNVPLHVLLYHRMEAQLAQELDHVIRFINETSIVPRTDCALKARNYLLRRKKPDWQRDAAVYSARHTAYLNDAIDRVHAALKSKTGISFDDMLLWKRWPALAHFRYNAVRSGRCFKPHLVAVVVVRIVSLNGWGCEKVNACSLKNSHFSCLMSSHWMPWGSVNQQRRGGVGGCLSTQSVSNSIDLFD